MRPAWTAAIVRAADSRSRAASLSPVCRAAMRDSRVGSPAWDIKLRGLEMSAISMTYFPTVTYLPRAANLKSRGTFKHQSPAGGSHAMDTDRFRDRLGSFRHDASSCRGGSRQIGQVQT